ncbi:MAG: hypothetical protein N2663_05300 [Chlorobi bacterium]|jgi:hypothetical protein|nr:hypothetical protein [Chlorobiota bacterium]
MLPRILLIGLGLLAASTLSYAGTIQIELKGDQVIVWQEGGVTYMTCGPATPKTCAVITLGAGNPGGGYPDKATLYDGGSEVGNFNCTYLGAGPSGDPTRDAAVIPEP